MRIASAIALALAVSACTVIRVEGPGARTMVRAGVLQIAPAEGAQMVAYRSSGFGLVPGRHGATLGWSSERAALVFDAAACRIVILELPKGPQALADWRALIGRREDICVVGETSHEDIGR